MWLGVRNYESYPIFNTPDDDLTESFMVARSSLAGSIARRLVLSGRSSLAVNVDACRSAHRGDNVLFETDPFNTSDFGMVNFIGVQGMDVYYQVFRERRANGRTRNYQEMQADFDVELSAMRASLGVPDEENYRRPPKVSEEIKRLNMLSLNILDPDLLLKFWKSSYKLDPGLIAVNYGTKNVEPKNEHYQITSIRMRLIADLLKEVGPDVIFLQETSTEKYPLICSGGEQKIMTTCAYFLKELGDEYAYFESFKTKCKFDADGKVITKISGTGCVILCKKHLHPKFIVSNSSLIERTRMIGTFDDVFPEDREGWHESGSCFLTVDVLGTAMTCIHTMMSFPDIQFSMQKTLTIVQEIIGNAPHVVAGDFNAGSSSDPVAERKKMKGTPLVRSERQEATLGLQLRAALGSAHLQLVTPDSEIDGIAASDRGLIVMHKFVGMTILKPNAVDRENKRFFFASDGTVHNDQHNFPISDHLPLIFVVNIHERNPWKA